jgi:hypothetical protein
MDICREVDVQLHTFLTPTLDGNELSATSFGRFTHWKITPTSAAWVGPISGLDTKADRKISVPVGNLNPVLQPAG